MITKINIEETKCILNTSLCNKIDEIIEVVNKLNKHVENLNEYLDEQRELEG